MSNPGNLSTNKYRVIWQSKQQVNGFYKNQSVVVFGEDAAEYVMHTLAKDSPKIDIIPVFGG